MTVYDSVVNAWASWVEGLEFISLTDKGSVYTWRTLTGVKLKNNWTQYSRPAIFWQHNQDTELELH